MKRAMEVKPIPTVKSTKALRSAFHAYAATDISTYWSLTSDSIPMYVSLDNLHKEHPNDFIHFLNNGSVALLWRNAKCKCEFAKACAG